MIEFKNVTKMYKEDKKVALEGVNFEIQQGEFVFFTGKSGAGKSTLLRMIYKEELPTSGDIFVFQKSVRKHNTQKLRRKMGVVFQSFDLLPNKTAAENIAYVLECLGENPVKVKKRTKVLLQKFGLEHLAKKYPKQLSGGEQQRVSIARAVATEPKLLICDEPTNNLDEENTKIVLDYLKQLHKEGVTILMATHDYGIIKKMNKKVIQVEEGQVRVIPENVFDLSIYGG